METTAQNVLNVTEIEPRLKHPTIFARFDELDAGGSLTILNDHDPKPLYYQLLGERGNIFIWEYLEEGPEWWKVRISKRREGEKEDTLGELAAKDLRKAQVFKKFGLDFCCGGDKTVKEACAEKGLDVTVIEKELQQADSNVQFRPMPYNEWELDFLADYIVNTHHAYLRKNLPDIRGYATKVLQVHGDWHPELSTVYKLVEAINSEVTSHMLKEEQVLFPYIKKMVGVQKEGSKLDQSPFGSVLSPVNMMKMEHEVLGNYLTELRACTSDYALPADACASYSLLYRMLNEMEDDLHLHIHLENNILFPKAIELESSLRS